MPGHEWAKRQRSETGIAFESLDDGFLAVADPLRAQAICDGLDALAVESFFERWLRRLPSPSPWTPWREDRMLSLTSRGGT